MIKRILITLIVLFVGTFGLYYLGSVVTPKEPVTMMKWAVGFLTFALGGCGVTLVVASLVRWYHWIKYG